MCLSPDVTEITQLLPGAAAAPWGRAEPALQEHSCCLSWCCFAVPILNVYLKKKKSTKPVPFTLTDSVQAASQAADPWLSCVQEVLLQDSTKTHFPESRKVLHPSDSPSELWVVLLRLFVQSGQGAERSGKHQLQLRAFPAACLLCWALQRDESQKEKSVELIQRPSLGP